MSTRLHALHQNSGQSIWLDNLSRPLISSGELADLVEQGVRGVTSNPAIFQQALQQGDAYAEQLADCKSRGLDAEATYWELVSQDIKQAAITLRPVYDASKATDGFVSVEVDPRLAHDTAKTVAQAKQLFESIGEPNVMIKVPATPEGLPAITELIASGINVNVTLIFSLAVYEKVLKAYMAGLSQHDGSLNHIASVASFFVSRVDASVDELLPANSELRGSIALAQARVAYQHFLEVLKSEDWKKLEERGAQPQRPLWASTSTKNPDYPDTLYIDGLTAPNTVNTVPPATLQAYLDHGTTETAITHEAMQKAQKQLSALKEAGIDLSVVTTELEQKGVQQFIDSFNDPLSKLQ